MGNEVQAISRTLGTQLIRMGQIQQQLDAIQRLVQRMVDGHLV